MTAFAWHVHHDTLVEVLTEPIENRVEYIKRHKPEWEIEPRLRLLKPVQGELPAAWVKARAAYVKARAAYVKVGAAYFKAAAGGVAEDLFDKATAAYDKATTACLPEIEALHAIECPDCPWDGETIFPGEVQP